MGSPLLRFAVVLNGVTEQCFDPPRECPNQVLVQLLATERSVVQRRLDLSDQGVALARESRDECQPRAVSGLITFDGGRGLIECLETELADRSSDLLVDGREPLGPPMIPRENDPPGWPRAVLHHPPHLMILLLRT